MRLLQATLLMAGVWPGNSVLADVAIAPELRRAPSVRERIVATLESGKRRPYLVTRSGWVAVTHGGRTLWARTKKASSAVKHPVPGTLVRVEQRTALAWRLNHHEKDDVSVLAGQLGRVRGVSPNGVWLLIDTRRGEIGWVPRRVCRLREETEVQREPVGTIVVLREAFDLLRRPARRGSATWRADKGEGFRLLSVARTQRTQWLLVADEDGRWGWLPRRIVSVEPAGSAVVTSKLDKPPAQPTKKVSSSLYVGGNAAIPTSGGKPTYGLVMSASGSRKTDRFTFGLGALATLSRTAGQTADDGTLEAVGAQLTASASTSLGKRLAFSTIAGYSVSTSQRLRDVPELANSLNGPLLNAALSLSLTSWMSAGISGGLVLARNEERQQNFTKSAGGSLSVAVHPRVSLSLGVSTIYTGPNHLLAGFAKLGLRIGKRFSIDGRYDETRLPDSEIRVVTVGAGVSL